MTKLEVLMNKFYHTEGFNLNKQLIEMDTVLTDKEKVDELEKLLVYLNENL
ncbi:hypothetical protein [Paraliobacillus ryukyuensis]|uniref:hypothetical protein n=1 Tax=Paraliobacillus ryukyuensis TaxID=200904 RepID=UPI0015C456E5|nr:hypothetical protein [Paraliobacillus ryukyuensis]